MRGVVVAPAMPPSTRRLRCARAARADDRPRARRRRLDEGAVHLQRRGRRARRGRRLRLQALDPAPARARGRGGHRLPARRRRRRARAATTASCSRTAPATRSRSPRRSTTVRELLGRVPVLGICLGHQLLGRATGLETSKLPFGHRGANHPVLERATGRVLVTARTTASASTRAEAPEVDARLALRRHGRGARVPGAARAVAAVPSRGGPGPARRVAADRDLGRGARRCRVEPTSSRSCLIGSGPIVIGQACEFDYAGCQALKVLREDGFRTIVVNSNPATIMTDPGFADRTYLEPLDLEGVASVLAPRAARRAPADDGRPDGAQPRARARARRHPRRARRRADRRAARRDRPRRGPAALQGVRRARRPARPALAHRHVARPARRSRDAGGRAAGVHARRPRRRLRRDRGGAARADRARPPREPDRPGARRGVGARLGRVRARGRPRPHRQRRDRLLDREPRPDGRAHGRLGDGRAADDASRRGLPGAARRGRRDRPRGRRRVRRLEHPVRARPRDAARSA